ncbi:RebB family R body protein [Vitiosangium sp. GDMCC 1.1324]|uniref:RebB family R body protein n=1 Tax=Vitiosangium sp. (strain GDMCC 1.1324) TaxID=2138576 RepID=UPI000D367FD3|nr:RebB family R body protein [Vitiosangium sp. GDMCC 1.1324]PTL83717.1 R body protein RebB-like protein [Vitiosangium sp. GDMCC 1.1324]
MADTTEMNAQVTDAVTQANLEVAGSAPAHAAGQNYQSLAHSLGLSFQNAVAAQQQNTLQGSTGAVLETWHLLSLGTAQNGAMAASLGLGGPVPSLSRAPRRARSSGRRTARRP